jgi:cytochrome bd-type quinol oxidase subunit 1
MKPIFWQMMAVLVVIVGIIGFAVWLNNQTEKKKIQEQAVFSDSLIFCPQCLKWNFY